FGNLNQQSNTTTTLLYKPTHPHKQPQNTPNTKFPISVTMKESSPNNNIIIQGAEKKKKKKLYGLLLAARESEYVKNVYGGYLNVFVAAFGQHQEEEEEEEIWDLFRVVDGEFPEMDLLHKYDGFVISGSPYDAYANDSWILNLIFLLQTLDSMKKKLLGICFGHQVLCRALGGKVGKATTGWDIGLRRVRIVKDLAPSPGSFLEDLSEMPTSLSIIECHQDEVWEVPSGAEVIAFSDKTGVEMFTIGDHILGIQGHPEYTKDILCSLIDRLLQANCIEQMQFAESIKYELEIAEPDRTRWEKICRNFLKGK
ncbi:Gamma-glutamyl peptidase 5, partial [Linum perenne]